MPKPTLVVNLFAGPGTGKSTTAALLFGKLKLSGVVAELAPEFAKDLVWEDRKRALHFQPYIVGKQMWRIQRLIGQVDVVITDSPILFGLIYGEVEGDAWTQYLLDVFESWRTYNVHLLRNPERPYVESGRTQSAYEAGQIDGRIAAMLEEHDIPVTAVRASADESTPNLLTNLILSSLGRARVEF